ncbi:MAG TPA: FAD-dependent oxidoreductase, partial [Acetobacteraceae bacterium]|nr:FAD-dependent oxidoreductase [Acetobacteraceae bacterium]
LAIDLPLTDGVRREEALARDLRLGPQTKALRHLAHAERVAARAPVQAAVWPVRQVGVVGGGTMGSGIAVALADAGLDVTLVERDSEAEAAARVRVRAIYDRQLSSGRLAERLYRERTGRIAYATELRALRHADLVIEAVVEDLDEKRRVFRALSGMVRRDTLLASNTSYLDIDLLADEVDAPERVLGLHFFSPAHVMRLVEVVRTRRLWPEALATALATVQLLGKQPVVTGVCDGFIGNRILGKWRAQAEYALEDGATPAQVDAALEAYGMAMGIFAVFDLAGLDVDWRDRQRKAGTRDPRERYVPVFDWICEQGHYGQKTGRGFYIHEAGKRIADPEVVAMAERASALRGIARRAISAEEVQQRVHAAMVNEAARVLADGIAARPSDIDVVLVHGYGFPAWRGGPLHEADAVGIAEMLRRVEALYSASGAGWEPAPLLREMAAAGKRFADLNG